MGQIVLELGKPIGDFRNGAAGDPHAIVLDVEQSTHAVHFRLNDPGMVIVCHCFGLGVVEVLPRTEQHRHDLGRERFAGVILSPMVIAKGGDVRLLSRTAGCLHLDSQGGTFGLKFGQILHGRGSSRQTVHGE